MESSREKTSQSQGEKVARAVEISIFRWPGVCIDPSHDGVESTCTEKLQLPPLVRRPSPYLAVPSFPS